MGLVVNLYDRLVNVVSGLGTDRDKVTHDKYTFTPLNQVEVEAAYRGDWIAKKVVNVPSYDMTREWRNWQAEQDAIEAIEKVEKQFSIRRKVMRAMIRARLYGGGALVLGVNQGSPESELDIERLGKDSLKWVHVMSRHELTVQDIIRDVGDPRYGEPRFYSASSIDRAMTIHPSRVIRFVGAELPDINQGMDGWGDSVLDALDEAVRHAGLTSSGIASLVHEAKIDVIRLPNLMANLATVGYSTKLISRFALAMQMKSINQTLLLDKDEEYEQKQIAFDKLPEILQTYLQIAAGAADIPATRLLGQAPAGMNSTGESDVRNYYDRISSDQEVDLCPALAPLDEIIIRSALGSRPDGIYYEWAPLWQLSESERSTNFKLKAEAVQIFVNTALVPNDALAKAVSNMLIEDGMLPGLEEALEASELGTPEEFALGEKEKAEAAEEAAAEVEAEAAKAIPEEGAVPAQDALQARQPAGTPIGGQFAGGHGGGGSVFSQEQKDAAVFSYTSGGLTGGGEIADGKVINTALRNGSPLGRHTETVGVLDASMAPTKKDMVVHRAVPMDQFSAVFGGAKAGDVFKDDGFTSFSKNQKWVEDRWRNEVRINLKKGSSALEVVGKGQTKFSVQREVILPRGSRFKVVSVKKNVAPTGTMGPKRTIIELELL